ncbi:hypothetical protein [Nannocystis pusilla]|uniref:hypothetical protein n=1 Tax=Nannocystis pusilla TaxID=889268 RepID=UPI003DA3E75C
MRQFILAVSTFLLACDSPEDADLLEASSGELARDDAQDEDVAELDPGDLSDDPRPAAAGCQYKVIWPTAGVYEQPGWNVLKTKNAGEVVGASWCDWTWYDGVNEWLAVATDSAEDGVGWMRRSAVVKL